MHEASVVFGTRDFAAHLPPRGGCLVLEEVPEGVHAMRVGWDHYWDPSVALRLALGLCGAWGWRSLRGSRLLHALMGSIGFLVVIAAGVAWFVISSMQGFVQNQSGAIPLGRLVTTLVTCLVAFVPAARDVLIGWALPTGPLDWYTWINLRDPFFDLPIGWIAAIAAVVGGGFTLWLGAHLSMQYFASAPDPEGDMDFKIGPQGERVDALPPTPRPQRLLGWVIWAAGLALILLSTHSDAFSAVLAVIAVGKDNVLHCVATWRMAMQAARPEELRPLISTDEYERLGRFHTDNALQALQRHIRMNPRTVHRVREDSELRLRRFSEGGPHCHRPCEFDWGDKRGMCVLL